MFNFGKSKKEKFVKDYEFTPATLQTFQKLSGINPDSEKGKSIQKALKQYYMLHVSKDSDDLIGMPSQEIDHLWHAHILDTQEYHSFCEKAFGYYLHHIPFVKGQDTEKERKANKELVQRAQENGYDDLMSWLPAVILAETLMDDEPTPKDGSKESDPSFVGGGCGSSTSDSISSHGDSSSSSSCASSSSSCGGSSCGGGCGGGCGA